MVRRKGLRVCTTPGCGELVSKGRCPECERKATQQRGSARARGYDAQWERTRADYLQAHPYCECDECAQLPELMRPFAVHVHHKDGLGPLGPRGHDWTNLQALTHAHHSRHTAHEQPGGWHAG